MDVSVDSLLDQLQEYEDAYGKLYEKAVIAQDDVKRLMEENKWLMAENKELRDENKELSMEAKNLKADCDWLEDRFSA